MRQYVRSLMLLAVLAACAPDTRTDAERIADAARADSSAAGYDVGPATGTRQLASTTRDSGTVRAGLIARRDSVTQSRAASGSGATMGAGASAPPRTDSAALAVRVATSTTPGSAGADTTRAGEIKSTVPGQDSGTKALQPLSPAVEASYLVYDSAKRTAIFQLAAGNELPQVSFNGVRRGMRTLTVPLGWRVTIEFANRDPDLPHSAVVVAANPVPEQLPEQLPEVAFTAARTVRVAEGLLEGDSDEITFVADRAGRYLLACGVLGHAQRGQWLAFEVSPTASVPRYR